MEDETDYVFAEVDTMDGHASVPPTPLRLEEEKECSMEDASFKETKRSKSMESSDDEDEKTVVNHQDTANEFRGILSQIDSHVERFNFPLLNRLVTNPLEKEKPLPPVDYFTQGMTPEDREIFLVNMNQIIEYLPKSDDHYKERDSKSAKIIEFLIYARQARSPLHPGGKRRECAHYDELFELIVKKRTASYNVSDCRQLIVSKALTEYHLKSQHVTDLESVYWFMTLVLFANEKYYEFIHEAKVDWEAWVDYVKNHGERVAPSFCNQDDYDRYIDSKNRTRKDALEYIAFYVRDLEETTS